MTSKEPHKINKDEAEFHSKLIKFLNYNKNLFPKSFLFETKVIRRNNTSFPFNELSEKEERLLLQAKNRTIIQTHSDLGGTGTNCDGSVISGGGIIFIQKFTIPENKIFYAIDIEDFIDYRDNKANMKSMREEEFKLIGREFKLYKIYEM